MNGWLVNHYHHRHHHHFSPYQSRNSVMPTGYSSHMGAVELKDFIFNAINALIDFKLFWEATLPIYVFIVCGKLQWCMGACVCVFVCVEYWIIDYCDIADSQPSSQLFRMWSKCSICSHPTDSQLSPQRDNLFVELLLLLLLSSSMWWALIRNFCGNVNNDLYF